MSSVSLTHFIGEHSSPNPQDAPPGACQSVINAAIRQEGTIEADRGYAGLALPGAVVPTTATFIDSHNSLWSQTTPANAVSATPIPSLVAQVSPQSLQASGFLTTQGLIPWGWDLGLADPTPGQYYSASVSMQETGWLMTSRGLAKAEQLSNLQAGVVPVYQQTTTPIAGGSAGQFTIFNTTMLPPATADAAAFAVGPAGNINDIIAVAGTHSGDSASWLPPNFSVAYRFVIARKVLNPVTGSTYFQFSEPSSRVLFTNTTGSNINVEVDIPNAALVSCPPDAFLQIYRSQSVPSGVTPSDEMYLVQETTPGFFVVPSTWGYNTSNSLGTILKYQDVSPDATIYIPLYTNAGLGNGIQSSNSPAPVSNVMFSFGNRVYYGDTSSQQSLLILMAGLSTTSGLQAGDTITIAGQTYLATVATTAGNQFAVTTASNPSVNIRLTSIALVAAINFTNQQTLGALPQDQRVFAQYISLGNGDEGQILIRRLTPGAPGFTVQTSATRGWAQNYTTPVPSSASPSPGGLYWSKLNQPPHVPIANNVVLGSPSAHVLAGVALRDYAIIFKEDGAWTVQETASGPAFAPLDSTIHVEAPRTCVAVQNTCFALTSKGVLAVGQYGTENISVPIQREIQGYLTSSATTIFQNAFAISYESEAEYWLFLPAAGSPVSYQIKVYNLKTKTWRTAQIANFLCGIEGHLEQPTTRIDLTPLMLGCAGLWGHGNNSNFTGVLVERKSYTSADQQWDALTPVLTDIGNQNNGTYQVSTTPNWSGLIGRGDLLLVTQGGLTRQFVIQSAILNAAQSAVIISFWVNFTGSVGSLASITTIPNVQSTIALLPEDADQPLLSKHWNGAGCLVWMRYYTGPFFDVGWNTELSPLNTTASVFGPTSNLFVGNPQGFQQPWAPTMWGSTPWTAQGADWITQCTIDGPDVRGSQLDLQLNYFNALSSFQLSSITFDVDGFTDRSVRA